MPFVSICSAMPISEEKKDFLQKEIGRLIEIIPGKNIDNCMTHMEGGSSIFMSGKPAKALFCEVRMRGVAPKESKGQLTHELYELFSKELGAEKVYIHFVESEEWGINGKY